MKQNELTRHRLNILRAMAEHDRSLTEVSQAMGYSRNAVLYHVEKITKETGLNPRRFYDLVRLLGLSESPERISLAERQVVYQEAIEKYGPAVQRQMVIEEMSELTKEICKISRGKLDMDALADEIADVTIMLEQLQMMYGINSEVAEHMDYKVKRLSGRIHGKGDG